jgi:hypothetical protein
MTKKPNDQSGGDLPKLAAPARRALAGAGYTHLEQLTQISEDEIRKLHGIGPNALDQLRRALEARGLSFAGAKKSRG